MALSYNLPYQEIISVHPARRQIFAGKTDSTFWNIWQWVICGTRVPTILNHMSSTGSAGGAREGQNVAHLGNINGPCRPRHINGPCRPGRILMVQNCIHDIFEYLVIFDVIFYNICCSRVHRQGWSQRSDIAANLVLCYTAMRHPLSEEEILKAIL